MGSGASVEGALRLRSAASEGDAFGAFSPVGPSGPVLISGGAVSVLEGSLSNLGPSGSDDCSMDLLAGIVASKTENRHVFELSELRKLQIILISAFQSLHGLKYHTTQAS